MEEDGHYKIEWWDGSYEYRTQEEVRANPVFVGPRPEGVVHIHEQIAHLRKQLDDANGKINALQCAMATASEEEVIQLINKIFNEPAKKSVNRVVRIIKTLQSQADNNKGHRIIQEIINIVNQGHTVKFERDWGGNSVTVHINDRHTHCGLGEGSFDLLISDLYDLFVENQGLLLV